MAYVVKIFNNEIEEYEVEFDSYLDAENYALECTDRNKTLDTYVYLRG